MRMLQKGHIPSQVGGIWPLTALRGVAALSVLYSHMGMMFYSGGASAAFLYITPIKGEFKSLQFVNGFVGSANINFGAFGVALFFLLTGFLVPRSLEYNSEWKYLKKRLWRIYPVYIVGFSITFGGIYLYTKFWAGIAFPYGWKDLLWQCSLLSDWAWRSSIDKVSWTLEAQMKFYLFALLLKKAKVLKNPPKMGITAVALAGIASILHHLIAIGVVSSPPWFGFAYIASMSCLIILYMLLGVCVYNLYKKYWTSMQFFTIAALIIFLFTVSSAHSASFASQASSTQTSYFLAFFLFIGCLWVGEKLPYSRVIHFIATISYSVYIVHGLNGYMLMSVLDGIGVSPIVVVPLVMLAMLLLGWLLYILVEKPLSKIKVS